MPAQFFDRQHIGMLVAHHRDVVQPIHVRQSLQKGLVLGEFLGGAVQQSDVGIGAFDHLAVQLQHQAQHTMRGRMLRPEVHGVILDFRHHLPSGLLA